MKNQIEVKNGKVIYASVSVRFFKDQEDGNIVATCPALKITTYGKNLTQAKKMFQEAFSLWLETSIEDNDLADTLRTLGWTVTPHKVVVKEQFKPTPYQPLRTEYCQIPISVMA